MAAYALGSEQSIIPVSKSVLSLAGYTSFALVNLGGLGVTTDARYASSTHLVDFLDPFVRLLLLRIDRVVGTDTGGNGS